MRFHSPLASGKHCIKFGPYYQVKRSWIIEQTNLWWRDLTLTFANVTWKLLVKGIIYSHGTTMHCTKLSTMQVQRMLSFICLSKFFPLAHARSMIIVLYRQNTNKAAYMPTCRFQVQIKKVMIKLEHSYKLVQYVTRFGVIFIKHYYTSLMLIGI